MSYSVFRRWMREQKKKQNTKKERHKRNVSFVCVYVFSLRKLFAAKHLID